MQADNKSCELLLRAIAQSAHREIINRLALAVHDWDALLTLAREHRVLPMLFSRLADMGDVVPLPVAEQLQAENERKKKFNYNCEICLTSLVTIHQLLQTSSHHMNVFNAQKVKLDVFIKVLILESFSTNFLSHRVDLTCSNLG